MKTIYLALVLGLIAAPIQGQVIDNATLIGFTDDFDCAGIDNREIPAHADASFKRFIVDQRLESPPANDHDHQTRIPTSLKLCGKFDLRAPTLVFFHGWSTKGASGAVRGPQFALDAGYNVINFHYHRDSYDRNLLPYAAERRLYSKVIRKLFHLWLKLGSHLRAKNHQMDYDQEIRFVGHSLGGQTAVASAYYLHKIAEKFQRPLLLPQRVEMLDTFVNFSFLGGRLPIRFFDNPAGTDVREAWEYMLEYIGNHGVKVVSYSSAVANNIVKLCDFANVQKLGKGFADFEDGQLDFSTKHGYIVNYYFESFRSNRTPFARDPAKAGFSALTPSEDIPDGNSTVIIRMEGDDDDYWQQSLSIVDDRYGKPKRCR